jgi:hypothetical protein
MTMSTSLGQMTKHFTKLHIVGASRSASEFGKHWLDYLVVIFGCIAYVAALNLTSRGQVKIDQFEYWLLGLGALAVIIVSMRAYRYFAAGDLDGEVFNEGFFASAWLLSLLEFVALRVTLQSESYEFPLYASLHYNYVLAGIILSILYSVLGYATALAIRQLIAPPRPYRKHMFAGVLVGVITSAMVFFIFVNPSPH